MTIHGTTQVLGVLGDPVAHSLSPTMHAHFARETGADAVYVPFHVRPGNLARAIGALPSLAIRGVNITVPHKEATLSLVDDLGSTARTVGAVNTVTNEEGRLVADNTDAHGFRADLEARFPERNWAQRPAVVLGSGGAARAVVYALMQAEVPTIRVVNRTVRRGHDLVEEMCPQQGESWALSPESLNAALADAGLIVNTTSLGLKGENIPGLNLQKTQFDTVVYDLIYNPPETPLLTAARTRGLATANGLGMLVRQGAISFETWTGLRPAVEPVIHALAKTEQT